MSYWGLPNGTNGIKQSVLRSSFVNSINKDALFLAIDSDPALRGAAVFFIDDKNIAICLREFKPIIRQKPISVVLHMPTKDMTDEQFKSSLISDPYTTKLLYEAVSALTSCAGFSISYFAVASAIVGITLTGPIGAVVIGLGLLGTAAAATQCGNGLLRVGLAAGSPETLKRYDDDRWYQAMNKGLDIISLAAIGSASFETLQYVKLMAGKASTPMKNILVGLTNNQKIRLQEELLNYMHKNATPITIEFLRSQKMYLYTSKEVRTATFYQIRQSIASFLTLYSSTQSGVINDGIKKIPKGNQVAISILH